MWERAMTFTEYVSSYGLSRSEGTLLRYLSDAYRALRSGVPEAANTEALTDVIEWLGALARQTDSSLLDEWEKLAGGGAGGAGEPVEPKPPAELTANTRAFTVLVRNAMFRRVELAALRRYAELGELDAAAGWDTGRWRDAIESYFGEYDRIGTGGDARNPAMLHIDTDSGNALWRVRQVFDDPNGDHDWGISAEVSLPDSDTAGEPAVTITDVGPL
jgi:hypothetical protein